MEKTRAVKGAWGRGGGGEWGHGAPEFLWLFSPRHTSTSSVSRAVALSRSPDHSLVKGGWTPRPVEVKEDKAPQTRLTRGWKVRRGPRSAARV